MISYILLGVAAVLVVFIWGKLHAAFDMFRVDLPRLDQSNLDDLPTVSVCIPARDEMHAMTSCLENVLLSTYPKLEIIVLDDGSRDDTGHLIKSFAHSGVRFVEGTPLPDGWLGKNHALDGLLREASGNLILFADVDTQFSMESIDQLVAYMLQKNAAMVSVLPYRENTMRSSAILATFRHFWNIVGHTKQRPAVASSAWMVRREVLESEFNGFNDIANDVRPERTIAKRLSEKDLYRFIISSKALGVSYEKKLSSQYETSIRVYYPDFGLGGTMLRVTGLMLIILPYVFVVYGLLAADYLLAGIAFAVTLLISIVNAWYLGVLRSNNYGIASLCLPFIVAREVYLLIASVIMYKRRMVKWKGRPVSLR